MRTQRFGLDDSTLCDEYAEVVDVYVIVDGGQDDDGNEKPPYKDYFFQQHPADIQPKSGTKRAAESGTVYESTHVLFLPAIERQVPRGAIVDVKPGSGAKVITSFEVVFPANHGSHLELDLRVVES